MPASAIRTPAEVLQRQQAIRARWDKATDPAQRKAQTRPARIASAVRTIVDNWPELRPEQVARLRALLQPVGGDHDGR